jgi:DNA-binding transcriptional LysR family regulator
MSTQARAFLTVAIEGSFTGAAKRLNVSQPSITTQVGLIERQYKVELFHRIGRGVRLTPAGTALLPMVRRLFTSLDEATAYLQDLRGQRQGYFRVGSYTPHRLGCTNMTTTESHAAFQNDWREARRRSPCRR